MRKTLRNIRLESRLPEVIGLCPDNIPGIAKIVNEAQQRLINAGGETGWFGGWVKAVFNVSRANPYITLPREFSRAINLAVCQHPVRIQNEFYQVLPGGPGIPSDTLLQVDWCGQIEGYDAGTVPTMIDLPETSYLRIYASDPVDVAAAKRVLFTVLDQNGLKVYSPGGVDGFYLYCQSPFTDSTDPVSRIVAVNKDGTAGNIILKAVDVDDGTETTLATYAPTETMPAYRRYQITGLPTSCCPASAGTTLQVTALCKLEFIPASVDTDYLIIGNIPALVLECQAIRFEEMDNPAADDKAAKKHAAAITELKNEMRHYLGEQVPAVSIDRWQGSTLQSQSIGTMQ